MLISLNQGRCLPWTPPAFETVFPQRRTATSITNNSKPFRSSSHLLDQKTLPPSTTTNPTHSTSEICKTTSTSGGGGAFGGFEFGGASGCKLSPMGGAGASALMCLWADNEIDEIDEIGINLRNLSVSTSKPPPQAHHAHMHDGGRHPAPPGMYETLKKWDKVPITWTRISFINSITSLWVWNTFHRRLRKAWSPGFLIFQTFLEKISPVWACSKQVPTNCQLERPKIQWMPLVSPISSVAALCAKSFWNAFDTGNVHPARPGFE